MIALPCINEFPYRLEITDLSTEKKDFHYVKTEDEVKQRLKDNNEENFFVAGWNRMTQDLIGMSHQEVV